jgi:phage protein U
VTYEITWSATAAAGVKPNGIAISYSTNTGESWTLITGETSNTGVYTWEAVKVNTTNARISVEAEDNNGNKASDTSNNNFTIYVLPPLVTVEAPNGGETWTGGGTYEITWTATAVAGIKTNGIALYYSVDSGSNWNLITGETANTGIYSWEAVKYSTSHAGISVEAEDNNGNKASDTSDNDFTIVTSTAGPTIEAVWINGIRFRSGDLISKQIILEIMVSSEPGVKDAKMQLDDVHNIQLTYVPGGGIPPHERWTTTDLTVPPASKERHIMIIHLVDNNYNETYTTMEAIIKTGGVQVIGKPINYPNPFSPMSGGTTSIQYILSKDAAITLVIYDTNGHQIKRVRYGAGTAGGRGGTNQAEWNGTSVGGDIVGNGMYFYKIISGDEIIASGTLVIFDQ